MERAEVLESLAQRYHKTPAEILREPPWLLRHAALIDLAHGER